MPDELHQGTHYEGCEQSHLACALHRLNAERERSARLEADAVRYRWLRNHPGYMGWEHDFRADEIDTAVDREMAIEAALTPTAKEQT